MSIVASMLVGAITYIDEELDVLTAAVTDNSSWTDDAETGLFTTVA